MPHVNSSQKQRKHFDSPWKDVMVAFFREFIEWCFPDMAENINWQKPPIFLDKELRTISKGSAIGSRTVGKLVKLYLLSDETI